MSPGMTTSAEVRRRQRLALPLLPVEFIGVPLIILGLVLAVEVRRAEETDAGFDVIQVVPVLILLALGAFIWSRNRFKPARWAASGAVFGTFGGGLCGLLGWTARRVLTRPVVEELADTRYALAQLTRVDEVHIDGYGCSVQPQLPLTIQAEVGAAPGPALGVQAGQLYWVIPVEDAGQVARLIQRRMRQSAGYPR